MAAQAVVDAGRPVQGRRDRISLIGISAFGYHGVFDYERQQGQRFVVDVSCTLDLSSAADTDDLGKTIDYAALAQAVAADVERDPLNLIEALADRIALTCLRHEAVQCVDGSLHIAEPVTEIRPNGVNHLPQRFHTAQGVGVDGMRVGATHIVYSLSA